MGFYNVVTPCVVGNLHYVRPTTAPIEVDDDVAAPLLESGCLEQYGASSRLDRQEDAGIAGADPDDLALAEAAQGAREAAEKFVEGVTGAGDEPLAPRRGRKRTSEG